MNPLPALCVVNFNGESDLLPTLSAVGAIRDQFESLLVVDNHSSDDSLRFVRGQFPFMEILSKRRVVQASRRVPDREILEGGPIPFASQMATSPVERAGRALLEGMSSTYWHLVERWL